MQGKSEKNVLFYEIFYNARRFRQLIYPSTKSAHENVEGDAQSSD